jgi:phosphate transport system substrate-binding protein
MLRTSSIGNRPRWTVTTGRVRQALTVLFLNLIAVTGAAAQEIESLSPYKPEQKVSGVIRIFGSELAGMVKVWEEGFRRFHPAVRFEDRFPSSDAATAGLVSGVADIGTSGREPVLTEFLAFNETFKYDLVYVVVATGAHDFIGRTWAPVVFVHEDNPITKLTMEQLDGIFGAARTGGYQGYKWMPQYARSAKDDIRTWGQLGLRGEWEDRPIQTYGYANTGMAKFFELKVFHGGEKWNPNYREYVESGTRMVSAGQVGESGGSRSMLAELSKDKYGIGWSGIAHAKSFPHLRPVALALDEGGPYVLPSRETIQNRTYPLARSVFMYIKHPPGQPFEPKLKEFLRYVLSREGQEDVLRHNVYLPLTAVIAREQLQKVE